MYDVSGPVIHCRTGDPIGSPVLQWMKIGSKYKAERMRSGKILLILVDRTQ